MNYFDIHMPNNYVQKIGIRNHEIHNFQEFTYVEKNIENKWE